MGEGNETGGDVESREFFDHPQILPEIETKAPVGFRDGQAEQTHFSHALQHLRGNPPFLLHGLDGVFLQDRGEGGQVLLDFHGIPDDLE